MYKEFDMRGVGKKSAISKVGYGSQTEKYRWTQTMNFVDIFIPLPELVCKRGQLLVEYSRQHLKVAIKGQKEAIIEGRTYGALRVDDCTWTIEEPDGVHEKFESASEDENSSDEDRSGNMHGRVSKRKVLHLELAKFDNDQITKEVEKSFWCGVLEDGPLIKEPGRIPHDYFDTYLNDKEAGRLWGDGAREDNRKFG